MNYKLHIAVWIILSLISVGSCKQQPVDAVYYGDWVNTYTQEYDYETGSTSTITEESWTEEGALPPTIHLLEKSRFFQFSRTTSNIMVGNNSGKWSIRNNNDITIQTGDYLFYGKIILLNGELSIDGLQYQLDKNFIAIQDKAIQRKLTYRKAQPEDLTFIAEFLKKQSTTY